MLSNELKEQITQKVAACIELANQTFNQDFTQPSLRFDIRGKTAGMALLNQWQLRFNPVLLNENPNGFLQEVVQHEISHLLVYALYGKVRPHGKEWQNMMQNLFSLPPTVRHNFDISSVEGRTFLYHCLCSEIRLSVRRHNKIQKNQARYLCKSCRQIIKLGAKNSK